MFTNYIKNFPQHDFDNICSQMQQIAHDKLPLWNGTVYVGNQPLYIECHVESVACKIEKYFANALPKKYVNGAKKLYVLDYGVEQFIKTPQTDIDVTNACFLNNQITNTPDLITSKDYVFLKHNSEFYVSVHDCDESLYSLGSNHLLMKLFNYIFVPHETVVLHGAVIGDDDYGVLITGLSGSGKSTLAALCLTNGLKFVGDDRIAISKENDNAVARPIYKTISLDHNIDGLDIADSIPQSHSTKNNLILNPKYINNYITIRTVIEPRKTNAKEPKIIQSNPTPILTRICMDFSRFSRLSHNMNLLDDYNTIYNLLGHIDYHIIELSDSVDKNAKCIMDFIAKGKANV